MNAISQYNGEDFPTMREGIYYAAREWRNREETEDYRETTHDHKIRKWYHAPEILWSQLLKIENTAICIALSLRYSDNELEILENRLNQEAEIRLTNEITDIKDWDFPEPDDSQINLEAFIIDT